MKARQLLSHLKTVVVAMMSMMAYVSICFNPSELQAASLPANKEPIVARLRRFEVKPNYEQAFRNALSEYVIRAIAQHGNVMAEAYHEDGRPTVLWLIERWTRPDDATRFSKSEPAALLERLHKDALSRQPIVYDLKDLEPLTGEQWRASANSKDEPITIMLFVDAVDGSQKEFAAIYHVAMPQFRGEPGVITYQLSGIEGDDTQFVTYEKFRSPGAFEYHLNFHAVKPILDYLEKKVKHPPFQNGLHKLVEIAPLIRK